MEKSNIQSTQVGEASADGAEVFTTSRGGFMNQDSESYEEEDDYKEEPLEPTIDLEEVKQASPEAEEEEEENEDEEGTEEEEGEEEGEDDEELDKFSEAAIIAKSLQNDGDLPEDFEITEDMDWYSLKDGLKSTAIASGNAIVKEQLEGIGEAKKYVEYLLNGGNINTLASAIGNTKYSGLDIEGDGEDAELNREAVIRAYYVEKDLPSEDIENLVQDLKDSGKDVSRAEQAKKYFSEKEDGVLQAEAQQRAQQQAQYQAQMKEKTDYIEDYISGGTVGDFKLSKKEQKELHQAIFVPTEIVEGVDAQGNKVRQKVTKITLLERELQSSPEKQVIFAKLLLNGFNIGDIKAAAASERDDQILNHLNGRSTTRSTRTKKRKTKPSSIQSTQVGEY